MITITENDFNLKKILRESKLTNLLTKYKYHAYGLRQENNPAILIEYNADVTDKIFSKNLTSLVEFFKLNGIQVETFDDSDIRGVTIGFRRDLRNIVNPSKQPVFASAVLSTIIYTLENRVNIEQMKQYKLSSIPTLPINA